MCLTSAAWVWHFLVFFDYPFRLKGVILLISLGRTTLLSLELYVAVLYMKLKFINLLKLIPIHYLEYATKSFACF